MVAGSRLAGKAKWAISADQKGGGPGVRLRPAEKGLVLPRFGHDAEFIDENGGVGVRLRKPRYRAKR